VYQQYCLTCHGLNGDGNGPAGANLRIRPPSFHNPQHFLAPGMDGAHFWVVQHGDSVPGGMPAWQGTLTDQQMWDVVNYVKQIAAGQAQG
jgi:mono/diheme cytochrome c family protein